MEALVAGIIIAVFLYLSDKRTKKKALEEVRSNALAGNRKAQRELAFNMMSPTNLESMHWLRHLAERGDLVAIYHLATLIISSDQQRDRQTGAAEAAYWGHLWLGLADLKLQSIDVGSVEPALLIANEPAAHKGWGECILEKVQKDLGIKEFEAMRTAAMADVKALSDWTCIEEGKCRFIPPAYK